MQEQKTQYKAIRRTVKSKMKQPNKESMMINDDKEQQYAKIMMT